MENKQKEKLLTISQLRHELDIPLIVAKKLILKGEIKILGKLDGKLRIHEGEIRSVKELLDNPRKKALLFIKALGPGLITGASDDDPSGIGTYSSVGAQFGYSIIWMAAWLLPVMLAVQEICARIGIVTNKGLSGVLLKHYRKKYVAMVVFLLLVANIVNIGADLGAMAASLKMLANVNLYLGVLIFAFLSIAVEVFVGYHIYVKFLKWLTISVLAYIVTGIIVHPDWGLVIKEVFVPQIELDEAYIFAMIAVFGTTITPYLFFWQASEEVEENKLAHRLARKIGGKFYKQKKTELVHGKIARMRTDVGAGMILANIVFFFIVLTTAQVLFKNGIHNIASPEDAALALRPLAGEYAYFIFAAGIIGTGLLAVPILAGSGAYAISEIMMWKEGLELKFRQAKGFYLVIISSIIFGMIFNFLHINPITALYWAAFLNGIIALPLLVVIMIVGNDRKIMGRETHPGWIKVFGWLAVVFMALAIATSFIMAVL